MSEELNKKIDPTKIKEGVNMEQMISYQNSLIAKLENRLELIEGMFVQHLWALNETALVAGCLVQHLIEDDDETWQKRLNEAKKEMLETIVQGAADAEANNSSFVPTSPNDKSG